MFWWMSEKISLQIPLCQLNSLHPNQFNLHTITPRTIYESNACLAGLNLVEAFKMNFCQTLSFSYFGLLEKKTLVGDVILLVFVWLFVCCLVVFGYRLAYPYMIFS